MRSCEERALAFRPSVLLFDEPLNALDEATRDRLCELLRKIQQQTGVTTLHVTHSRSEARQLADQLIILKGGRLSEHPVAALNDDADWHGTQAPSNGGIAIEPSQMDFVTSTNTIRE